MSQRAAVARPPKLQPGDRVRLVSPASTPTAESVERAVATLEGLGLKPEVADHVFDEEGHLAGTDNNRLSDFNSAIRDVGVKAIIATRGGKGAYRIADRLDFAAMRRQPKLVVGFSEITVLHMILLKECGITGLHGAAWDAETFGETSADSFARCVMTTDDVVVESNLAEHTSALTTNGGARGPLIGGNQDLFAIGNGWALPNMDGAIWLIEAVDLFLGHIDRQLTMLANSGALAGIVGVAVGQYTRCGGNERTQGEWTDIDVLRDRLRQFGVPILGGLPLGHGDNPLAAPIGTMATLDADAGTLTVSAAVQ